MFGLRREYLREIALLCCVLLVPGDMRLLAQEPSPAQAAPNDAAPEAPIPADQLDSLVAPIALYPDPLLAQVLAASTYPLEIVQLRQFLEKNKGLKENALADAVKKQNWDPSVQSMAALPDVVKQMEENIKWTSELGNAFLGQQSDVMDAVQRMRAKAKDSGKLKSSEEMKVETKVVESKTVVVIEQSNPKVVYVPSYDPVVVWGAAPVYAYPPIAYPPGYYAAGAALAFGAGLAMGAMWGGGWGYGAGWGGNNNININNNNNFVRNSNRNNVGSGNRGNGNWQHNPSHRGGTPYGNRSTANKFGGTARGDSAGNRQASARQNSGQRGGGASDRSGGAGSSFRSDSGGRSDNRASGGGGDRVGNRQTSGSGSSRGSSTFGSGGGMSGSSARSSSSRGSSSMSGSRGGGGGSRGGGGGSRGGGGRRR